MQFSVKRLFQLRAPPEKAYEKGHRRYARGLKFCILWMSAILPTTGLTKVKEAKAEGVGFKETGGGRNIKHGYSFCLRCSNANAEEKKKSRGNDGVFFLFFS